MAGIALFALPRRDQRRLRPGRIHPRRVVEADEYWAAQGFIAARLGLALIPALALGTVPVQAMITASRPKPTPSTTPQHSPGPAAP